MPSKRIAHVISYSKALLLLVLGVALSSCGGSEGKATVIEILLENIATDSSLVASDGIPRVVAFSPAFGVVHQAGTMPLFSLGTAASAGLESMAEDGNFGPLIDSLSLTEGVELTSAVNTPEGEDSQGPLLPGGSYRLLISVQDPSARLSLVTSFIQGNDIFVGSPEAGLELFDAAGNVITGDRTAELLLLDAGTEVNQEPGVGPDQAPRQMELNQGAVESGLVRAPDDGFSYPAVSSVLRVSVNVVGEFDE